MSFEANDWCIIVGAGAAWLGSQISIVGGLPRALRRGQKPSAPRGSREAFGLFWLDQYAVIGLTLLGGGLLAIGWGVLA